MAAFVKLNMTNTSPHWLTRNRSFERQVKNTAPGGNVFLGDSLTEEFDLPYFFPQWPVINRGISGDHIDGLLKRVDTSVSLLKPSRLFIMIGINDIADGKNNAYILESYRKLIRSILEDDTPLIYIQSVLPTSPAIDRCPPGQITDLNRGLQKLTREYFLQYIDLYTHFVKDAPWIDPDFTTDGLHLSKAGYTRWAEIIKVVV